MAHHGKTGMGSRILHAGGAFALAQKLLPKKMPGRFLVAAAAGWAAVKFGPQLRNLLQQRHGEPDQRRDVHLAHGASDEPGAHSHSAGDRRIHPAGARSHGEVAMPTVNRSIDDQGREREID